MTTKPIKTPRPIAPELVDIGDDISTEFKSAGVSMIQRGIVDRIHRNAGCNTYYTKDNGVIMRHYPGKRFDKKITLYGRSDVESSTLFSLDNDEVRTRIA
jgi:hypothetical protein